MRQPSSFNRRWRFFLGATPLIRANAMSYYRFNRRWRFFLGATANHTKKQGGDGKFQSQVAILFGGYNVCRSSSKSNFKFQSQVAILFGGYRYAGKRGVEFEQVSIAGGDSFWGLQHLHFDFSLLHFGFNRRWRFFLGATVAVRHI